MLVSPGEMSLKDESECESCSRKNVTVLSKLRIASGDELSGNCESSNVIDGSKHVLFDRSCVQPLPHQHVNVDSAGDAPEMGGGKRAFVDAKHRCTGTRPMNGDGDEDDEGSCNVTYAIR